MLSEGSPEARMTRQTALERVAVAFDVMAAIVSFAFFIRSRYAIVSSVHA